MYNIDKYVKFKSKLKRNIHNTLPKLYCFKHKYVYFRSIHSFLANVIYKMSQVGYLCLVFTFKIKKK